MEASDSEERSGSKWRLEGEFDPQVALEAIDSRNALSGPGGDGLRFSHLQSITTTEFTREKNGDSMKTLWRRIIDDTSAIPPGFRQLFLNSNLTASGENCRPICVRMTWRRLLTAATMRQSRPRLEKINREARQCGGGVRGGVEQVALRARIHHETKTWLILTDCSNAFNTVKQMVVFTEAATCVPALTPFVAKSDGERSAPVFFQIDPGERRKIDCSSGCNKGTPWGRRCFACRSCRY